MKFNCFIKILSYVLITSFVINCIANDNYSMAIQVNYDNCIMILYKNNTKNINDKNSIVAKTYCAIINSLKHNNEALQYDIFLKHTKPLLEVALQTLKLQLASITKQHYNYIPVENIVTSFYNYTHENSDSETKTDYIKDKVFFSSILKQLLIQNRFFINRKIIIVENNQLLTQAALEYFYNTEIDKSQVDKLLVANINIEPNNTEVITNADDNTHNKKNMLFISKTGKYQQEYQKKERSMFYTIFEDSVINYQLHDATKTEYNNKLMLTNNTILQYKIYKLFHNDNPDILITNEYLQYNKITDNSDNNYNSNYQKISNMVIKNAKDIQDIFIKDKIDYVILLGNALLNNVVSDIYFKQLEKTHSNLPSDRIYMLNNEEFYYYLVVAAKTILALQTDNIEDDFKPSIWGFSNNTNVSSTDTPSIDKDMVNKMNMFLNNNETSNFDYHYVEHSTHNYDNQPNNEANNPDYKYEDHADYKYDAHSNIATDTNYSYTSE